MSEGEPAGGRQASTYLESSKSLTPKGIRTRSRILEAAAERMFERGVARTSLEDVREAAAVSGSQLSHYFHDKDALVHGVIDLQASSMRSIFAASDFTSVSGFRAWRDVLLDVRRQMGCVGGCPLGSLASELAAVDPKARVQVQAVFGGLRDTVADGLRVMRSRDDLPSGDPDRLASATIAAVEGGLLLSQIHGEVWPLEEALGGVVDLVERCSRL